MSIKEILEKCKSPRIFVPCLVVMVALASFGLGRLSVLIHKKVPVVITHQ